MRNLFNPDAPIIQTASKIAWMMWYSCLWVLCSLPMVTIGASTAALYTMTFRLLEDGNYSTGAFFRAFRDNFKKASMLWLWILLTALALAAAYYGILWIESDVLRLIVLFPFMICFVLWGFSLLYGFPLTAFFENTVRNTMKNALAMSIKHLRQSIYCFALAMIPVLALLISPYWFLRLLYLWVFVYPCVGAYWIGGVLTPVFSLYAPAPEEQTNKTE